MQNIHKLSLMAALLACTPAFAGAPSGGIGPFTDSVANANAASGAPANVYSMDFSATVVATGTDAIENPSAHIATYGKLADGIQTEPDQNTFLSLSGTLPGPTANYPYGHNFLFQGHENASNLGYVTRINLDVTDPAHRITLMTPEDGNGSTGLNRVDGSTYNPFTQSLLITQEGDGTTGGVVEVSMGFPATVTTRYGTFGRCGLEGVHVDKVGRIYLVEDTGGTGASNDPNNINGTNKVARQPNSYIYRFVPYTNRDLSMGGQLWALQVMVGGAPLVFGGTTAQQVFDDVWSTKQIDLHSGQTFPAQWIKIHDTQTDGTADFNCNLTARAAGATPFKRPENGTFKPDGTFSTFYFTITGDTNNLSGSVPGLAQRGAWGGLFEVDLKPQNKAKIKLIALGDSTHNSFDNITFGDSDTILTAEDRGDTLHDQLNTLDSVWAYPLASPGSPLRVVAQGRDTSASGNGVEDNEPTGVHVSNGGKLRSQMYGTAANLVGARGFFTQQHGDNTTYELTHN